MLDRSYAAVADLIARGGVVMWPLLALCFVAVMLCVERAWFWATTNGPWRRRGLARLERLLRDGELDRARERVTGGRGVYDRAVAAVLDDPTEAGIVAAIQAQRPRLERFMAMLSTIITAAPMLGILGTVLGIIQSFDLLAAGVERPEHGAVSRGIAEALITTAAGLAIAIATLLPYNAFRAQIDRALGRLDVLTTAAAARPRRGIG